MKGEYTPVYSLEQLYKALIDGTVDFKPGNYIWVENELYQCYKLTHNTFKAFRIVVTDNGKSRIIDIIIKW